MRSEQLVLVGGHANVEPWLLVQGSRTTTQKTRYIAQGHQLFRADREQTDPIQAQDTLHSLADKLRDQAKSTTGQDATRLNAFADKRKPGWKHR